jgi:tetratricopeptide (TPR) repeat protein
MNTKSFPLFLASLALPIVAFAQSQLHPMGPIGPTPPSDESREQHTGDFLLGRVTVAGGALPWDAIPVNVTCNGKTRYTVSTDAKGNFVIAPDNPPSVTDTTVASADATPKLAAAFRGCTVQAALPGFNSSTLTIADRNLQNTPDIGTITLNREENAGGTAVSSTTASAPKDAAKAFERARTEWIEKKPDKAQKDLEKAVQVDPQFAEAWYQLGKIQEAANSPDAINSYSKAVAADPKFSPPYDRLAALAVQANKWQDAADATAHALQLNPRGTPVLWYYSALANYRLAKIDVAETAAEKALAMDPQHTIPNTEQLLAVILIDKQDYVAALQHLRNSQTYLPPGPNLDLVKQQIAQLEQAATSSK